MTISDHASDCAIVGAGVIGLSIAYELARRGRSVTLFDRSAPATEASWAGAGILPPAPVLNVRDPIDQLRQFAMSLHPAWAERLTSETGIDTGFRRCGALHAAQSIGEKASLIGYRSLCQEHGIEANLLTPAEAALREPALSPSVISSALELPGECQLRNPWHLKALVAAITKRGVEIRVHQEVTAIHSTPSGLWTLTTAAGQHTFAQVCVAAGSWTQQVLAAAGCETSVFPMRGQMVLYRSPKLLLRRVLNVGPRYLVPREDGRLLVGSTEEEVGFDKRNTEEGIAELRALAEDLIPGLRGAVVERTWAGLRPASFDSLPYMGAAPGPGGLFVASGHFRSGIYLSPAVAMLMSDLLCGETPSIDLWPFRVSRG